MHGPAATSLEVAATALGLLPFLAAGQTHESKGPYRQAISAGITYLIGRQKADGELRGQCHHVRPRPGLDRLVRMLRHDRRQRVGKAAQAALDFIAESQDPNGGGWRYTARQAGDTSVTGWQVMALKSGQMAYLNVRPEVLEKAKGFLESVSAGQRAAAREALRLCAFG